MKVHSFLPLEDIEDKNNGCLLQITQAVRFISSANWSTRLNNGSRAANTGQAPSEGFSCVIGDA